MLLLLLAGLALPVCAFSAMATVVATARSFSFDAPGQQLIHAMAGPGLDRVILWIGHLGFGYGVVPFDIVLLLACLGKRRWREAWFVLAALGGSMWLNGALKDRFSRPRPDLWEPVLRYPGYSFPSGHAMATMTLTFVLLLLAWRTNARWPLLAAMGAFTLLVGISRVYLGVHYPSDVFAGWAAGAAWATGWYLLVFHRRHPWQREIVGTT